jgi:hypothetical protein
MTRRPWLILRERTPQVILQEGLAATYGWIREEICGW